MSAQCLLPNTAISCRGWWSDLGWRADLRRSPVHTANQSRVESEFRLDFPAKWFHRIAFMEKKVFVSLESVHFFYWKMELIMPSLLSDFAFLPPLVGAFFIIHFLLYPYCFLNIIPNLWWYTYSLKPDHSCKVINQNVKERMDHKKQQVLVLWSEMEQRFLCDPIQLLPSFWAPVLWTESCVYHVNAPLRPLRDGVTDYRVTSSHWFSCLLSCSLALWDLFFYKGVVGIACCQCRIW